MTWTALTVGGVERPALALSHGDDEVLILPDLGGRIAAWRSREAGGVRDWLRPMPADGPPDLAPRRGGCYPLVPFSNRIENGRFTWQGREFTLAPSPIAAPHALHGAGWVSPWRVAEATGSAVTLELEHPGGPLWPWPFMARQEIALGQATLTVSLSVRNTGDAPQPVGLGLHPFLPRRTGARLTFSAGTLWRRREDGIPTGSAPVPVELDFGGGRDVPAGVDDVFAGWTGLARVDWPEDGTALEIAADAALDHAVLFAPEGLPFFCFEPVSHPTNAINMPGRPGLRVLEPDEAMAVTVSFRDLRTAG